MRQQRIALRDVRRGKGKIQAIKITIGPGEGKIGIADKIRTVTQPNIWRKADKVLLDLSMFAPKSGGYNKTDFTIYFADGDTYTGRYDMKHFTLEVPNLAQHVSQNVNFYTGLYRPAHLSESQYRQILSYDPGIQKQFREFTRKYDVPGVKVANPTGPLALKALRQSKGHGSPKGEVYNSISSYPYKLRFERSSWPTDDFIGTIRTVPENYYVATVTNRGALTFRGIEGMTRNINQKMVRSWWKAQRNLSNPTEAMTVKERGNLISAIMSQLRFMKPTDTRFGIEPKDRPDPGADTFISLAFKSDEELKHIARLSGVLRDKYPKMPSNPVSHSGTQYGWGKKTAQEMLRHTRGKGYKLVKYDDGTWGVEYHPPLSKKNPNMPAALKARARYQEDKKVGHGAAEYWRGQAGAFFTGNPRRGEPTIDPRLHQKLIGILITEDDRLKKQEQKRRTPVNIYRIGIFLSALTNAEANPNGIKAGLDWNFESSPLRDKLQKAAARYSNPGLGITGAAGSLAASKKINPGGWMYRLPGSTYANGPVQAGSKKEAMAIVRRVLRIKRLPAGTEFWYSRGNPIGLIGSLGTSVATGAATGAGVGAGLIAVRKLLTGKT